MQYVWEVCKNEEYFMQDSQGLFSTYKIARQRFPEYSEMLIMRCDENQELEMAIFVQPQFIDSAREVIKNHGFWWYNIKGDMGYQACIGIFRREVIDTLPNSGDNENDIPIKIQASKP